MIHFVIDCSWIHPLGRNLISSIYMQNVLHRRDILYVYRHSGLLSPYIGSKINDQKQSSTLTPGIQFLKPFSNKYNWDSLKNLWILGLGSKHTKGV